MSDLVELLSSKLETVQSVSLRSMIVQELSLTGDARAVGPLMRLLREGDPRAREDAAEGLARLGATALPSLFQALDTPDSRLKKSVIQILGKTKRRDAGDRLIRMLMLEESDPEILGIVVEALDAMDAQKRAVDAFLTLLKEKTPELRWKAAFSLGRSASPRAVDSLAGLASDPDPDLAWIARRSLERLAVECPKMDAERREKIEAVRRRDLIERASRTAEIDRPQSAAHAPVDHISLARLMNGEEMTVQIRGELFFNTIEQFDEFIKESQKFGPERIVVDFERCPFLDSFALSRLNVIRRKLKESGCGFQLRGLNDSLKKIFETTKLDQIFDII